VSSHPLFDRCFAGTPAPQAKPLSGADLRDLGIADALERAEKVKAEYVQSCIEAIKEFPSGCLITSEDIREKAGDPPSSVDRSVMAGILRKAASRNLIQITRETRPAKRVTVHAKHLACWRRM
jgi:hypothetical protein